MSARKSKAMPVRETVTASSGNVFADLGFGAAEAVVLQMRADLIIEIEQRIKAMKISQTKAASLLDVSQARVSDLMRHQTEKFSLDMLVKFAAKLGDKVTLTIERGGNAEI